MVTEMMESIKEIQTQLQENTDRISEGEVAGRRCVFYLLMTRAQCTESSKPPFPPAHAQCPPFSEYIIASH